MSSKIFARGIVGVAAMAGLVSLADSAIGADYAAPSADFVPPPIADKVEFASNWYIRGDLAYAQETFPKFALDSVFPSSPSVLNSYSAGAGVGYKVNDWFRTDSSSIIARRSTRRASPGSPAPSCCPMP